MTARYSFVERCKQIGVSAVNVSSKNTTRECPACGALGVNDRELLAICNNPICEAKGVPRDKDYGAAQVILRRGQQALAERVESA
jgi:transposase